MFDLHFHEIRWNGKLYIYHSCSESHYGHVFLLTDVFQNRIQGKNMYENEKQW